MAHEYGLDLKTILPLQAYARKYVAGTTQQGGGGGEEGGREVSGAGLADELIINNMKLNAL